MIKIGNNQDGLKKLDEFIEEHNRKRKKIVPLIIVIIVGISLFINFGMKVSNIAIAYLTYRLIKIIVREDDDDKK